MRLLTEEQQREQERYAFRKLLGDDAEARWHAEQRETAERMRRQEAREAELVRVAYEAGYRAAREDFAITSDGGRR